MLDRKRAAMRVPPALAWPALGWFAFFLAVPLLIITVYSVGTRGTYGGIVARFTFDNYLRAADWIYLRILWNSVKLATLTSVSCLLLGYPLAYVMATSGRRASSVLLLLVVVPFWTNFVVRAYAIRALLAEQGVLNQMGLWLGLWTEAIPFANREFAVWFGMVTNYLPFMVLPLFVALERFDFTLLEAARDLGASSWQMLTRVLVPLTLPGMVTGMIFVFTPALGEFVIPDLLGGAKVMMIGNLITDQFLKSRDWPFGAAISFLLNAIVLVALALYFRIIRAEGARAG